MATYVHYWPVGSSVVGTLPMSVRDISSHLVANWIPSLPAAVASSFIGWPPFLIEVVRFNGIDILVLSAYGRRCERQWKSVLSWMLGVAGTRHVLRSEKYRWIAPLSAFYPDALQDVDLSRWHPSFPPSSVTVMRRPGSHYRLRPDYVALRSTAARSQKRPYEWAVIEGKGTQFSLTQMHVCPTDWSNQVRNVVIAVSGSRIAIPRHIVVATRVNPNAVNQTTRRLQVRAWNRSDEPEKPALPSQGAVEIAAAHLFGLFRGLHLRQNALAIALSVQARSEIRQGHLFNSIREGAHQASESAEEELRQRTIETPNEKVFGTAMVSLETELGPIRIELSEPLLMLARKLRQTADYDEAITVLREADAQLDRWQLATSEDDGKTILPFGAVVFSPREFERRG
jgi:hypothetical protein